MASSSFSSSMMQVAATVAFVVLAMAPPSKATVDRGACISSITSLLPCQGYVQSLATTPASTCCTALTQVIQQQPLCLCAVLDGEASNWLGINIDLTRALAVPTACLVQPPSISNCLNVTMIVPSPPGTGGYYYSYSGVSSDASLNKVLFFGLLFVASFALIPFKYWF